MTDRAGFEVFYRMRLGSVVRACTLVTLDAGVAEEIAAEAFARTWAKWSHIQDEDHAGGYVYTTAMRLCAKRGARRGRERLEFRDRSVSDETAAVVQRETLFRALALIPLRQRQAVVLRDWAGYPTDEVARMLGIEEPTCAYTSRAAEPRCAKH